MSEALESVADPAADLAVRRRAATGGSGPRRAVLCLHGWPGTHSDWDPVFDRVVGDRRWDAIEVLSPDLRGYGASPRPPVTSGAAEPHAAYAPGAHLGDLSALLDRHRLAEVLVAGYDLGANLAQRLARARADRIQGLVLCDPVHPAARAQLGAVDLSAETWYQHLHAQPWAAELIAHDRAALEIYLRHFYTHWWGRGRVEEQHFQALLDRYEQPGAFEASIGWYRARAAARGREIANAATARPLATPAQILWGEADPVTPIAFADSLSASFTDFELSRLPGVGHFVPLEAPDAVFAALDRLARRLGWQ